MDHCPKQLKIAGIEEMSNGKQLEHYNSKRVLIVASSLDFSHPTSTANRLAIHESKVVNN